MGMPYELQLAAKFAVGDRERPELRWRKATIGCVIRRKDGALVSSRNVGTPEPTSRTPSRHAEARASRKCDHGSTAYVARVLNYDYGITANATPCHTCMAALRARGVTRVYYTIAHNEWDYTDL